MDGSVDLFQTSQWKHSWQKNNFKPVVSEENVQLTALFIHASRLKKVFRVPSVPRISNKIVWILTILILFLNQIHMIFNILITISVMWYYQCSAKHQIHIEAKNVLLQREKQSKNIETIMSGYLLIWWKKRISNYVRLVIVMWHYLYATTYSLLSRSIYSLDQQSWAKCKIHIWKTCLLHSGSSSRVEGLKWICLNMVGVLLSFKDLWPDLLGFWGMDDKARAAWVTNVNWVSSAAPERK